MTITDEQYQLLSSMKVFRGLSKADVEQKLTTRSDLRHLVSPPMSSVDDVEAQRLASFKPFRGLTPDQVRYKLATRADLRAMYAPEQMELPINGE